MLKRFELPGLAGTSNTFDVVSTTVDHFTILAVGDQVAGTAFTITITAEDASNNVVPSFTGTVDVIDVTGTIDPKITGNFTVGILSNFAVSITQSPC